MKFLILSLLSVLLLSASNIDHQVQILENIVSEISLKEEITIWSDDSDILLQLETSKKFTTTKYCQNASLIILKDKDHLLKVCDDVYIFVLNYKLLTDIPRSFGALFWKKGRPNIVILEPRIKTQNIRISENLEPYLEEKVW